jgi:hypothetical protein
MRIKFLTGPKAGQVDHVPNSQEFQVLASAGLIEILPYKDFRERLNDEMAAMPKPTTPLVTTWGVRHVTAPGDLQPRNVIVVKTTPTGDVTFFDGPPAGCPPEVVAKFRKESAVYAQIRQDRKHAEQVDSDRRTR